MFAKYMKLMESNKFWVSIMCLMLALDILVPWGKSNSFPWTVLINNAFYIVCGLNIGINSEQDRKKG